jgi:hypothetical protein
MVRREANGARSGVGGHIFHGTQKLHENKTRLSFASWHKSSKYGLFLFVSTFDPSVLKPLYMSYNHHTRGLVSPFGTELTIASLGVARPLSPFTPPLASLMVSLPHLSLRSSISSCNMALLQCSELINPIDW